MHVETAVAIDLNLHKTQNWKQKGHWNEAEGFISFQIPFFL